MSVLEKQILRARKINQPLFCSLELTLSCNYFCKHCYNFDRSLTPPEREYELTSTEIKNLLKDLKELGVLSINLTGGEPLLRKDILEIVQVCSQLNFQTRLKSNGFLLSDVKSKQLFENGLKEVDISLYGSNEQTYLDFCGKEGHSKTLNGIVNAKKAGIKVNVSIILHRENYLQLSEMITQVEKLKVNYFVSDEITDRYDKSLASKSLGLNEENYQELLKGPHSHFFEHKNHEKNLMCGCAKTVIGIGSQGQVYPCIGAPIEAGSIRKKSILEIWKKSEVLNKIRGYTNADFKDCHNCNLIEDCSRSSGSAYLNTGEYTGCDPVAYEHAKARSGNSFKRKPN